MVWGRGFSQVRLRAVAGEGKLVRWDAPALGEGEACSENCFLILETEEEGFLPARGPLRPGEEERKTEIEQSRREGDGSGQTGWEAARTEAPETHRP